MSARWSTRAPKRIWERLVAAHDVHYSALLISQVPPNLLAAYPTIIYKVALRVPRTTHTILTTLPVMRYKGEMPGLCAAGD